MNIILIFMTLPYENIVHIRHVLPCTRAPKIYIIATVKTERNINGNIKVQSVVYVPEKVHTV